MANSGEDNSTKSRELYDRVQRFLIGSLLENSDGMIKILELLNEDDIEEPSYSLIFNAMANLSRKNSPITIITVAEELQRGGNLAKIGGPSELYDLKVAGESYSIEAPVEVYARLLKESSAKAKAVKTLEESKSDFDDDSGVQASDAISNLQNYLNEMMLSLSDASTISDFNDFDDYIELLKEREAISIENANNAEGLQGIPSLLPSLNKYTTGWRPGQMITVGAGTGIGKSVFGVNCAVAGANAGNSVMLFSLEMGRHEIEDRIISSSTAIPLNSLRQGKLSSDERETLNRQMEEMKDLKITIDVEPKQTVDSIRARAIKQASSKDGLDLIIVDYLQLITPTGRYGSRQEAVADISRNMKLLAKQLEVPIMVLVQMKRKDDDDTDSLPKLDNIRESGAIAQDSDIVILLHRDINNDETIPHTLVILAKNRSGDNNKTIRCHSNLECSLFREVTKAKDVEELGPDDDLSLDSDLDLDELDSLDSIDEIILGDLGDD